MDVPDRPATEAPHRSYQVERLVLGLRLGRIAETALDVAHLVGHLPLPLHVAGNGLRARRPIVQAPGPGQIEILQSTCVDAYLVRATRFNGRKLFADGSGVLDQPASRD